MYSTYLAPKMKDCIFCIFLFFVGKGSFLAWWVRFGVVRVGLGVGDFLRFEFLSFLERGGDWED